MREKRIKLVQENWKAICLDNRVVKKKRKKMWEKKRGMEEEGEGVSRKGGSEKR